MVLEAIPCGVFRHIFRGDDCVASIWERDGEWYGETYAKRGGGKSLHKGRSTARAALIALLGADQAEEVSDL